MITDEFLPVLHRLADASGAAILPHFRARLETIDKGCSSGFDPVTIADREAEAVLRSLIEVAYPDHGIIGEEFGRVREDAEFVWVIDPIDGTKSFISGLPVWGTLIALLHNGRSVLGMLDQPYLGERYWGDGQQAFARRGGVTRQIATRKDVSLDQASVYVSSALAQDPAWHAVMERLAKKVRMLIYGGDCLSLAMLAEGHIDVAIGWGGFQIYDIAAHIPIVRGAGGSVTGLDGGEALYSDGLMAVGSPELVAMLMHERRDADVFFQRPDQSTRA